MSVRYHVNDSVVFECDEKKYKIDHKVFKKETLNNNNVL